MPEKPIDHKPRILCVDDEPIILDIMSELLAHRYDVRSVESGEASLTVAAEWKPDLVLLDVKMPGLNGLDTCRKLKATPELAPLPVIFVSAASSQEERIAGFDAGGQDYITKPFNEDELLIKVSQVLETKARIQALEEGSSEARKNETAARTAAAEMQVALKFMRESFAPASMEEMAHLLLTSAGELGLEASLHIHCKHGDQYFALSGEVGPLEKSVFEYVNSHDDLMVTGPRTLIHQDRIRLLINNMPSDDPARSGRLKAHLKMMCGGAGSRIRALEIELGLDRQRKVLSTVMQRTNMALIELFHSHQMREAMGKKVLEELSEDIQSSYLTLGLEADQEETLNQKLDTSNKKLDQLFDGGDQLDELFASLMEDIQDVLDKRPETIASHASNLGYSQEGLSP